MFSQTVEYALRAVVYLAQQGGSARTEQIAKAAKVPQAYLSKVLQALSRSGVIRLQRGVGGGVSLCRSPDEVTMLAIVNAVDPIRRIDECPLGLAAHGVRLCPLHDRLDKAMASIEEAFGRTTIAEVLAEPAQGVPRCGFPHRGEKKRS